MSAAFPKGRTAFLVIHGIGEQNPFETLDSFGLGLVDYFHSVNLKPKLSHQIIGRKEKTEWVESFFRIETEGTDDSIDVHEYYWAYLTEKKISAYEIWAWLKKTYDGTLKFYSEHPEELSQYLTPVQAKRLSEHPDLNKKFARQKSLEWLGKALRRLRLLGLVVPFMNILSALLRPLLPWPWLQGIKNLLAGKVTYLLEGYIGDIAIYTTTDQKSSHFRIRQEILAGSLGLLENLLQDYKEEHDQVILAGHSLGSVIAYDALNRLNVQANLPGRKQLPLQKLVGLITFGSPLDKIAFFFREYVGRDQHIRRQIIDHLHSFRARQFSRVEPEYLMQIPIQNKLTSLKWINYYSTKDPISGKLDYYELDKPGNIHLELADAWARAHVGYWRHIPFYESIKKEFF